MQLLKPIFSAWAATKTINMGAESKARIIMHIYYNPPYFSDDDIRITVGNIVKKSRTLPLPQNAWTRLSYNFPINTNVQTEFCCNGYLYHYPYYWIDKSGLSPNKQKIL